MKVFWQLPYITSTLPASVSEFMEACQIPQGMLFHEKVRYNQKHNIYYFYQYITSLKYNPYSRYVQNELILKIQHGSDILGLR